VICRLLAYSIFVLVCGAWRSASAADLAPPPGKSNDLNLSLVSTNKSHPAEAAGPAVPAVVLDRAKSSRVTRVQQLQPVQVEILQIEPSIRPASLD
jgi:hypothetical protein